MKKQAVFFTMDALLGAGIFFVAMILLTNSFTSEVPDEPSRFSSQDLLNVLDSVTVEQSKTSIVQDLISSGDITNLNNSLLEQIGEFWDAGEYEYAANVSYYAGARYVPARFGFGTYANGQEIYSRNISATRSLAAAKKITVGITDDDPPALWGPLILEVRVWE